MAEPDRGSGADEGVRPTARCGELLTRDNSARSVTVAPNNADAVYAGAAGDVNSDCDVGEIQLTGPI